MSKNKKQKSQPKQALSPWIWIVAVIAILAVIGAIIILRPALQGEQKTETLAPEISVAQALEKREAGAFILDVRQPEEWAQVHIPGATLIPLDQLQNRVNEVPKDQEVVVICRSGNRSATGRDILKEAGFTQVTSMAGGMNDWSNKGYPTASGQ